MTKKKKFVVIEPFTEKSQIINEIRFGAPRTLSKNEQAIAKLIAELIQEEQYS